MEKYFSHNMVLPIFYCLFNVTNLLKAQRTLFWLIAENIGQRLNLVTIVTAIGTLTSESADSDYITTKVTSKTLLSVYTSDGSSDHFTDSDLSLVQQNERIFF